jgi:hypothetical protein
MAIKHSKYRNTAILFELLVRQTTADLLQNKDSKAVKILKKHFTNTELGKEYSLYSSFNTIGKLSETKAEMFINTVLEQRKKLNEDKLKREKYNLIKEIKNTYDINNFFRAKIDNYKTYASVYTLFESQKSSKVTDTKQLLLNKINILEHITEGSIMDKPASATMVEEFMKEDKEIRLLAYKLVVEKFNTKYADLSEKQKEVLKEYINNISETELLKTYINKTINTIKEDLNKIKSNVKDPVVKIKLNETIKLLNPIKSNQFVKDETITSVLQYLELVDELKRATNERK